MACSYMYVLCSINLGYHYHGKKRSRSGPTSTDSDVCTVIQTSRTLNQVFVLIRLRLESLVIRVGRGYMAYIYHWLGLDC